MAVLFGAHALDVSGFLDDTASRIQAVAMLREQGITEKGLTDLQQVIIQTAQAVKQQRAAATVKAQ